LTSYGDLFFLRLINQQLYVNEQNKTIYENLRIKKKRPGNEGSVAFASSTHYEGGALSPDLIYI